MAGNWQETTLGECADWLSGGTPSKSNEAFWSGSIPWVSAKDMKSFRLHDAEDHISQLAVGSGGKLVPPGTVLLLVRGMTLHNDVPICMIAREMAFNQDIKALRPAKNVDGAFLAYWLLAHKPDLLASVDHAGHGTGRLVTDTLKRKVVHLPPLAEQKAIAAVLGSLDDKIELNRRMNATLEAMARALFANWIQSQASKIEAHSIQVLIDRRVLLIGDGYRAKNSEMGTDGLPFIRAGNLKSDGLDLAGAEILSARSVAAAGHKVGKVGDVAFTSKGTVGRITRVSSKTGAFVYSPQVCFWRSIVPEQLHPNVLFRWMCTDAFTCQVDAVSTQTDMAPYVSLQDQRKMIIQLPPPSAQKEIAKHLEPIDDKIASNAEQSRTLAALRDTLLPKLLSGEIRV